MSDTGMPAYPNPPLQAYDPDDSIRCKSCGALAFVPALPEHCVRMGICDTETCMESRITHYIAAELSKEYYAQALLRISRVVVPKVGDKIDVRKLQASLIAVSAAALHALNAPRSEIMACRKFIESRAAENHEEINEVFHLA